MEKQWKKQELISAVEDEMRRLGYTENTIRHYWEVWNKYLRFSQTEEYSLAEVNDFLKSAYGIDESLPDQNLSTLQIWKFHRMQVLKSFSKFGVIFNCDRPKAVSVECRNFQPEITRFIQQCEQAGYGYSTMSDYKYQLKMLALYFERRGVLSSDALTPEMVTQYLGTIVGYRGRSIRNVLGKLRKYFSFLYLYEYNPLDLSLFVPTACNLKRREHLPVILTREEIKKILDCVDTANPIGKRDYAIILLVARSGLRIGDVTGLKLSSIKWERNSIELLQEKTGQQVSLPLFEDVGAAIIDYLKNGRPISDSDNVFVSHYPPFNSLGERNTMRTALKKYVNRAGIQISSDKHMGMHMLRHSLATELLKNDVPLPIISSILGHKNTQSTENYLRVDVEKLKQCALTVEVADYE